MAFVYEASVFKEMAKLIGLADKNLREQLDTALVGSGISCIVDSRDYISAAIGDASIGNTDLDASTILVQAFRAKEGSLPSDVNTIYSTLITSIDTYFNSVQSKTMRNYFDSSTAARTLDFVSPGTGYSTGLSYFRQLYSRTKSEELIFKLYYANQPAGTVTVAGNAVTAYGWTSSFTNSALQVRLPGGNVGTATTLTVTGLSSTGSTVSLSVTVGSGTSASNVGTSQKFSTIISLGIPSGIANSSVEIWTR